MRFKIIGLAALALFTSTVSHAAANGGASPDRVAGQFVDALQHQRFKEAAAMFAPEATQNAERTLKRADDSLGGFATMHPVATLPDGKSIKLEVPAHKGVAQKFVQFRYASTASDGQPVFYELNLTAGSMPPKVLSFGLHLPANDAPSTKRADQLVSAINH
ncbi:hypothetical protein D0T25_14635 [Duganella sp. BJB488]|uniref:hypothetical protein n=1 Tax=unclassified Duganella TaxID=2636909 RepID=UPI000E352AAF|nr:MULTISPECIES: hypothetical protein [unclassified Duganella]RFP20433.1 hypothetical protein D0T26_14345 [Duganella sp. BJB489]RFP21127.1 hypothetical protein D0T25_14635 [Duganella sp. BJB488]RFP33266.1 hypothetical protein D0T24_18330 [Duganella sp. BJB480]